jgi:hypothetical protein
MEELEVSPDAPLRLVKKMLLARMEKGVVCPCCEQHVKVYRRTMTSAMAYTALVLYKVSGPGQFVNVPKVLNGHGSVAAGGDYAKLVYWGLLEGGSAPGEYRVTVRGRDFVECRIAVPKAVYVYNGIPIREDSSENVTIVDAMGAKYSYDSLMSGEFD